MVNLVTSSLDLPLFLATRHAQKPGRGLKYLSNNKSLLQEKYLRGKQDGCVSKNRLGYLAGNRDPVASPCLTSAPKHAEAKRELVADRAWSMSPNRYKVPMEPFANRQGAKGAYWRKLPKPTCRFSVTPKLEGRKEHDIPKYSPSKPKVKMRQPPYIPVLSERERKPTSRVMVTDPVLGHTSSSKVGPGTYNVDPDSIAEKLRRKLELHEERRKKLVQTLTMREPRATKPKGKIVYYKNEAVEAPHMFYRRSSVPVTPNNIHTRHEAYKPGPGHNETRFKGSCHCSSRTNYIPDLEIIVDRQKRRRFRRLAYKKLSLKNICSPEFRHVLGGGFRRLFILSTAERAQLREAQRKLRQSPLRQSKRFDKPMQLYADAKYITMLNRPKRKSISQQEMPEIKKKVIFNCLLKRVIRRQKRKDRKVGFLSTEPRFRERFTVISGATQIANALATATSPPRVVNQPVTNIPLSEIKPRIRAIPDRFQPLHVPPVEKKNYRFSPVPKTKLLLTEDDYGFDALRRLGRGFFSKKLNVSDYFLPEEDSD